MKKLDFLRYMGNIDEKYVIESENYKPASKKTIRVIALAACLAVIVAVIPLALILNREPDTTDDLPPVTDKDNTVIDNTEPAKIIYCSSSIKDELVAKYSGKNVEIRDSAEIQVNEEEREVDSSEIEDIPAKLFLTVGNHELVCSFSGKVYSRWASWLGDSKPEIYIAEYRIDKLDNKEISIPQYCVRYNVTNQELFEIDLESWERNESKEKIGEDAAKTISDQIMVELFGEDVWNLYQFEKVSESKSVSVSRYVTTYRVHIKGYSATQWIYVSLDLQGNITSVVTACPTRVDVLEKFEADDIKNASEAIDAIYESVCEGKVMVSKMLTVQGDNKPYWCIRYEDLDKFGEYTVSELFYPIG